MNNDIADLREDLRKMNESFNDILMRESVKKGDLDNLKEELKKMINRVEDHLNSMETKLSFHDYLVGQSARGHVPQPLSRTPFGNAVNEPRRYWRSENPYRR